MKVEKKPGQVSQSCWQSCCVNENFIVIFFNPRQLAKIKIEDDGSYVQLSEVNVNDYMTVFDFKEH